MNSRKLATAHAHELLHAHKTEHRHINPYGVLATQIADASLVEVVEELNEAARQVKLGGLIFPEGLVIEKPVADSQELLERLPDTSAESHEARDLRDIPAIIRRGRAFGGLGIVSERLEAYVSYLYTPANVEYKLEGNFGQLTCSVETLRKDMNLSTEALYELREAVAGCCLPVGLGFRSVYEYRYWLCRYMLKPMELAYPEADLMLFRSYRIRRQLEQQSPEDAHEIIRTIYRLLRHQKEAFEQQGVRGKCPRSTRRMRQLYGCTLRQAEAVISWYRQLPAMPAEDMCDAQQQRQKISLKKPIAEFSLSLNTQGELKVSWSDAFKAIVQHLHSEPVEAVIRAIQQCTGIKFKDERELEEKLAQLQESDELKNQVNTLDQATQFLLGKGEEKLVKQHIEIEGYGASEEASDSESNLYVRAKLRMNQLKNVALRYERLREAILLKPEIVEHVVRIQQAFLQTGDIEKLEPLTKSDIVKSLGYVPSGGKVSNKAEKTQQNTGRRIERYIKKMYIEYPDHRIQPLDALIPGHGGVKDFAGHHVLDVVIKSYIRELIKGEPRNTPLSDQKISYLLAEEYAVPVQRTLVKKYRLAMGIESSQSRK